MIGRVDIEFAAQFLNVTRIAGVFRQCQRGLDAAHLGMIAVFRRHHRQGLARPFQIAVLHIAPGQSGRRVGIPGLGLQHLAEQSRRGREIARLEKRPRLGGRLFHGGRTDLAGKAFDERLDLTFGQGADEAVNRLTVLEGEHCRNRLHPQLRGELLILVDVDLDEFHGARSGRDHLFDRRPKLFARAAPGCPEVDDDGHLHRGPDDVLSEGCRVPVLDQ